jgi:Uma2 family endonuclease
MDVMHRQFTVDEVYRMLDAGILSEGERVELIEGELLALAPHNPPHSDSVQNTNGILVRAFGPDCFVRVQLPLELDDRSEPEPDFAVVCRDTPRGKRHPRTALLVIEVANTSLRFDRVRKAKLYARAGIADYWILNVADCQLEVRRSPGPGGYAEPIILQPDDYVEPLALPGTRLLVRELLGLE